VINLTIDALYTSVVGNVWIAGTETGRFLTVTSASTAPSINGNTFDMTGNNAVTGAVALNIGANLTGNSFIMPAWTSQNGVTKSIVSNVVRCVVSGNTFVQTSLSTATVTLKMIVTSSTAGSLVTGNFFAFNGGSSTNPVLIIAENTAGGMQFTNNLVLSLITGSQYITVLNSTNLSYVYRGNITTNSTANPNFGRIVPVRNSTSATTAAISGLSFIDGNPGMPDIQAYTYK
jgi:hypothetical protein